LQKLNHIKIVYLPANTTSKLQPLDQGIIINFKVYYRKEVIYHILRSLEENTSPEINILQAMRFARKAWYSVSKITIANCFKKSGFKIALNKETRILKEGEENYECVITNEDWNKIISNENDQQPTLEDYVNVDSEILVSGEQTKDDIVDSCHASSLEENEQDQETCLEEPPEEVTKRQAEKTLETLHRYFERSANGNQNLFDKIYDLEQFLMKNDIKKQTKLTFFKNKIF